MNSAPDLRCVTCKALKSPNRQPAATLPIARVLALGSIAAGIVLGACRSVLARFHPLALQPTIPALPEAPHSGTFALRAAWR